MKLLQGEKIKLRALEPSDIDLLYQWENDTRLWRISNTLLPFSKNTLKKYIESDALDIYKAKQLRFVIESLHEKNAVGTIDLFDFDPYHQRAGVGILIAESEERKKGYASDALKVLIDYAFGFLLLKQLFCNIESDNKDSLNLFKKKGFSIVGEKKSWIKTAKGWKNEFMLQLINTDV